jgi:hypothetical protein
MTILNKTHYLINQPVPGDDDRDSSELANSTATVYIDGRSRIHRCFTTTI